jgi:4,5-DOPA dioxygenase extradiol
VQLAINAMKPFDYHLELGAKLAPLRDSGVLVIGSGNVVHNLGGIDPTVRTPGSTGPTASTTPPADLMADRPGDLPSLSGARTSTPPCPPRTTSSRCSTSRLGAAAGSGTDVLVDGYTYGSLSMTAYTLGR